MEPPIIDPRQVASTLSDLERWFLVYTLPCSELRARLQLGAQGFRTFMPQSLKTTRHARKLRTALAPFFPRYLFVILNLERDRWLSIRSTAGVSALVTSGERPTPVPKGVVEALVARAEETNSSRPDDGLAEGQQVRILSGSLAGFIGTLERLEENGRVRVLLEMMGAKVPVGIDRFRLLASS
jgi:transcription elongation factor/antiterminator RfaH